MKNDISIVVEIDSPLSDTNAAIQMITKLLRVNNLSMDLSISYAYDCEESGLYLPNHKGQSHRIFVNPLNCSTEEDILSNTMSEPFCAGYCADSTLFGVTIHEFCHLLQYQVYENIIPEYGKEFPTERIYLNEYCNETLFDELAEVMTLYITNPFLLKMISKKHWSFCKRFFKSPVACSEQRCYIIYQGFPIHVKDHMRDKWGITYDYNIEKFVRLPEIAHSNKTSRPGDC